MASLDRFTYLPDVVKGAREALFGTTTASPAAPAATVAATAAMVFSQTMSERDAVAMAANMDRQEGKSAADAPARLRSVAVVTRAEALRASLLRVDTRPERVRSAPPSPKNPKSPLSADFSRASSPAADQELVVTGSIEAETSFKAKAWETVCAMANKVAVVAHNIWMGLKKGFVAARELVQKMRGYPLPRPGVDSGFRAVNRVIEAYKAMRVAYNTKGYSARVKAFEEALLACTTTVVLALTAQKDLDGITVNIQELDRLLRAVGESEKATHLPADEAGRYISVIEFLKNRIYESLQDNPLVQDHLAKLVAQADGQRVALVRTLIDQKLIKPENQNNFAYAVRKHFAAFGKQKVQDAAVESAFSNQLHYRRQIAVLKELNQTARETLRNLEDTAQQLRSTREDLSHCETFLSNLRNRECSLNFLNPSVDSPQITVQEAKMLMAKAEQVQAQKQEIAEQIKETTAHIANCRQTIKTLRSDAQVQHRAFINALAADRAMEARIGRQADASRDLSLKLAQKALERAQAAIAEQMTQIQQPDESEAARVRIGAALQGLSTVRRNDRSPKLKAALRAVGAQIEPTMMKRGTIRAVGAQIESTVMQRGTVRGNYRLALRNEKKIRRDARKEAGVERRAIIAEQQAEQQREVEEAGSLIETAAETSQGFSFWRFWG